MRGTLSGIIAGLFLVGCSEPPPEVPPRQLPGSSPFHYPEELWDAGVEGETILELHVSPVGAVDSAKVERTSGYAEFDSAAVNGARELRFEPAMRGSDSVAVRVLLPVQFHLSGDTATVAEASGDTLPPSDPVEP